MRVSPWRPAHGCARLVAFVHLQLQLKRFLDGLAHVMRGFKEEFGSWKTSWMWR